MALVFTDDFSQDSVTNLSLGRINNVGSTGQYQFVSSGLKKGPFNDGYVFCNVSNTNVPVYCSTYLGANYSTIFCGFWLNIFTLPAGSNNTNLSLIQFNDGTTVTPQAAVALNPNGTLVAYRGDDGGTILGTTSYRCPTNKWFFIEFALTISATVGSIQIKVNNSSKLNLTNQNTKNATPTTANLLLFGPTRQASGFVTVSWGMSHLYFVNNSAGLNTSLLGPYRSISQLPTSNGTFAQFATDTPNTGVNSFKNVNINPSGLDSDYNSDSVAGHKDTFLFGALPSSVTSVQGVTTYVLSRTDNAAQPNEQIVLYDGVELDQSLPTWSGAAGAGYTWQGATQEYELGGGTTQMTPTYVNNLETGYKI